MTAYRAMHSLRDPTQTQIEALNNSSAVPALEDRRPDKGVQDLTLPIIGFAVIEIHGE
jgi:hypothetical protein